MKISTNDFANTHGKSPRGRGNWAFQIVRTVRGQRLTNTVLHVDAIYSEAAAKVRQHAAALSASCTAIELLA